MNVPWTVACHKSLVISGAGEPKWLWLCFKTTCPQDGEGFTAPAWANTAHLNSQTSYLQLSKIILIKRTPPGPGQESFCNTRAAPSVQACNDHLRFNTSKEFPSAQRVREAAEKSSLCRGLFSTNSHITDPISSSSPPFQAIELHKPRQVGDLRSGCNGVSRTCSHNQHHGEKIQE